MHVSDKASIMKRMLTFVAASILMLALAAWSPSPPSDTQTLHSQAFQLAATCTRPAFSKFESYQAALSSL